MDRGRHPDYSRWIVTTTEPRQQVLLDPPVPAVADVQLYDGTRTLVEVDVVARARGVVCVRQDVGGRDWYAWVSAANVRRRAT